jgi:S-adenosylmethionine decarboxylase
MELFGFGPHLMIDGYHANPERLGNAELIRQVLEELPTEMDMTKVMTPHVQAYEGSTSEDAGFTGVVIIAESHIAIHTFPKRGFLSVDVFSCKEFDVQKALNYLIESFEMGRYDTHFINRGKEFPKDLAEVERIMSGEREYLEARIA